MQKETDLPKPKRKRNHSSRPKRQKQMTEREYRAHPAISRSELWRIRESPEKFRYYREHPSPPTAALVFGQLYHKMVLQPESLGEEFAAAPALDRRTKAGREEWERFGEEATGKTVVAADMAEQAAAMCRALYENDLCRRLLEGEKEKPFFWTDELTNEECKCRCDIVQLGKGTPPLVVDLKTTRNAATDAFNQEIFKHGYHFQAAMYTEGVMKTMRLDERPGFCIIAQEKTPPYSVNVITVTPDVILYGLDVFRELLGVYHECKETGYWYGYNGPFDLTNETYLPGWLSLGEKEEEE